VLQAGPGETVAFALWVQNNGSTRDTVAPVLGHLQGRPDRFSFRLEEPMLDIDSDGAVQFIVNFTLSPSAAAGTYSITFTAQSSVSEGSRAEQVLTVVIPAKPVAAAPPPGPDYLLWSGISILIAGACLMVFIGGTEIGLLAFLQFILVPLFVRLRKDHVLDHFTRGQIFGFIKANPGTHYIAIQEHMELQNGVLAYHLAVLEREEYIVSERDGIYKRFYPRHMKIPRKERQLSRVQLDIISALRAQPGTSQNGLARMLGESKQVIGYHIRVLEKAGIVRVEREAQGTRCFLAGEPVRGPEEEQAPPQQEEPEPAHEIPEIIKEIRA
jgi:predicted transcriptional regulator